MNLQIPNATTRNDPVTPRCIHGVLVSNRCPQTDVLSGKYWARTLTSVATASTSFTIHHSCICPTFNAIYNTICAFILGRSQHNVQWTSPSPLTAITILGYVWTLLGVRHPSFLLQCSYNHCPATSYAQPKGQL
jgi:hypothetical protein